MNSSEERRGFGVGYTRKKKIKVEVLMKLKLDIKRKPRNWVMIFCMISGVLQYFYFSFLDRFGRYYLHHDIWNLFWIRNKDNGWCGWAKRKIKQGHLKYLYYEII